MKRLACVAAAAVAGTVPSGASAQQGEAYVGEWFLSLHEGSATHTGVLTLEADGDGAIAGFVDGGPVPLMIDGSRVEIEIDFRDGGGRLLSRELSGRIDAERMAGEMTTAPNASPGTWDAVRASTARSGEGPPVDLSGVWSRISSGTAKVHLDYTPAAQRAVDSYHYLDDPALRCLSPGLVRVSGWPYPLEIVQSPERVTILYESFHEVRRIDLDGRGYPDDLPNRAMGYSLGRWEGSTLVVETSKLSAGFVDLHGQPLSENARVVERMSLSDDGQTLRSELTLYDPVNYRRPVVRHRAWRKTPDTTILEYDCDPYPFFRGLALEGRLDEYWDRMRQLAR